MKKQNKGHIAVP